jgi:hypothetical protein
MITAPRPPSRPLRRAGLGLLAALALVGAAVGFAVEQAQAAEQARAAEQPLADDASRPVVTFTSFQAHEDGSATIRVDLTRAVTVRTDHKGTTLRFTLVGASIRFRNNRYPLRTEHFVSNVLSTRLDSVERDTVLTVTLRAPAPAKHELMTHAAGASLTIDVPPPPPAAPPSAPAPAP